MKRENFANKFEQITWKAERKQHYVLIRIIELYFDLSFFWFFCVVLFLYSGFGNNKGGGFQTIIRDF